MRAPRILIINPFGIGDVLFTTPLVRTLRQVFPESTIGYLCNRRTEPILRYNPHLNVLFIYEKDEVVQLWRKAPWQAVGHIASLLRRIRAARFDVAIDLSLGGRYSLVLAGLGIRRRIGFDFRGRGRFLTQRLAMTGYQDAHVIEYYGALLRFIGIRLIEPRMELYASDDDECWARQWLHERQLDEGQLLIGIVPAGGVSWGIDASFRRWGFERFAVVANALIERYQAKILLFGEASDRSTCEAVQRVMKYEAVNLSGQTSLGQFISLLSHLGLVICNDGGPLHIAVSRRVKTVSIFGPVDPLVYGSYPRTADHRMVYQSALRCRPCYHQFRLPPCPYERSCLTKVEPEEVIDACTTLLNRSAWNNA